MILWCRINSLNFSMYCTLYSTVHRVPIRGKMKKTVWYTVIVHCLLYEFIFILYKKIQVGVLDRDCPLEIVIDWQRRVGKRIVGIPDMMLMSNTSNVPFAALHSTLHSWASASRSLPKASAFLHPAAQSSVPEHSGRLVGQTGMYCNNNKHYKGKN